MFNYKVRKQLLCYIFIKTLCEKFRLVLLFQEDWKYLTQEEEKEKIYVYFALEANDWRKFWGPFDKTGTTYT